MKKQTRLMVLGIALILSFAIIVYAEASISVTNNIPYPTTDKALLIEKGFQNLPYSAIDCTIPNQNCTFYVKRAGKDFEVIMPTTDSKQAPKIFNATLKSWYDGQLAMLKNKYMQNTTAGITVIV